MCDQHQPQPAATGQVASKLIPDDDNNPESLKLNAFYTRIVSAMMNLVNHVGPKIARQLGVRPSQARGVFMACHQQMLSALVGLHWGLSAEEQLDLNGRLQQLVKEFTSKPRVMLHSGLVLPENIVDAPPEEVQECDAAGNPIELHTLADDGCPHHDEPVAVTADPLGDIGDCDTYGGD